ncbi:MAG: B12-binding domain-containing radical SAM protein, partial [Planctomycetota bacterium]
MGTKSMLVSFVGYPNEVFNFVPDNGLANLAACLIRAGHETVIWDCSTVSMMEAFYPYHEKAEMKDLRIRLMEDVREGRRPDGDRLQAFYDLEDRVDSYQDSRTRELGRKMGEHVKREGLDFVGFKLWTGAGFHGAMILAEEIKKANPGITIFGGGPHVDWFMHRTLEVTGLFNVLAYGEGEEVIVQLAEHVEGRRKLQDVSNAIYRDRHGRIVTNPQIRVQDMDSIPLPCYDEDVYPAMRGDEKVKILLLDESRGCPNSCNFCIHPAKSGRRRRTTSATVFADRLEEVMKRYGFRSFRFAGSNPPVALRRDIAREILRRGLDVSFSCFTHARGADPNDFALLKRAGCRALALGVESGCQRILDESMNKRVKVEDLRRAVAQCKEAGIAVVASVIVPAPHETDESKEETFRFLCDTWPDAVIVSFPAMMIGTAW